MLASCQSELTMYLCWKSTIYPSFTEQNYNVVHLKKSIYCRSRAVTPLCASCFSSRQQFRLISRELCVIICIIIVYHVLHTSCIYTRTCTINLSLVTALILFSSEKFIYTVLELSYFDVSTWSLKYKYEKLYIRIMCFSVWK